MARNIPDIGVIPSPEARKNLMNLSQRMIQTFCANISSSNNQSWTALSESSNDTIRVATRKNTEPGQPNGVILTAVSTVWLPFSQSRVFDLLSDEQKRTQLDALSYGNSLQEVAHIANGSHQRNCVSLMRINVDIPAAADSVISLLGAHGSPFEQSSWELSWSLPPLNSDSIHQGKHDTGVMDEFYRLPSMDEPNNVTVMAKAATRIAILGVSMLEFKVWRSSWVRISLFGFVPWPSIADCNGGARPFCYCHDDDVHHDDDDDDGGVDHLLIF